LSDGFKGSANEGQHARSDCLDMNSMEQGVGRRSMNKEIDEIGRYN
jgi:hypothetical protein